MTAQKLELRDVSKRFAEREAVRDLSLTLGRGEFLSLLGPSGCGKSTTLGMIAGFIRPDAGVILIDGALRQRVVAATSTHRSGASRLRGIYASNSARQSRLRTPCEGSEA